MPSLAPNALARLRYSAEDIASLRQLGEYRGKQELFVRQRPEVLETLRTAAVIESSESSNRLEGIVAPRPRIEALVLKSTRPRNRTEQEIAGYRDALHLLHQSAPDMPFTANVILQLHATLYRYLPQRGGRWKMTDNEIVERGPAGELVRVRFTPVAAVATPHAMEELTRAYRAAIQEEQYDPLVLIPLTILDFLCIHPFTDGNGRVARLLTLQLLYHAAYEVGRYISLERIFEESKDSYYDTLEASSKDWHEGNNDVHPWMRYLWGTLLRAYKEFEERVGVIDSSRGSKTRQVRAAVERKMAPFSISELERDCPGVSRDMIRRVLRQMRDKELLVAEGQGRGAKWRRIEDAAT